jgi:hypothetical protein
MNVLLQRVADGLLRLIVPSAAAHASYWKFCYCAKDIDNYRVKVAQFCQADIDGNDHCSPCQMTSMLC